MNYSFMTNFPFLSWFVGFCDAEGNFQVYPKKRVLKSGEISKYNVGYGFHICLHERDLDLIKDIHRNLAELGVVHISRTKAEVRLAVNDNEGLLEIIRLFSYCPPFTSHQLSRFLWLKHGIENNIKEFKTLELFNQYRSEILPGILEQTNDLSSRKEEIINNWIVGFINGEGSFYLRKGKCEFSIEHTDRNALELIKSTLDFAPKVSDKAIRSNTTGGIRKKTFILTVSSKNDINRLVAFLDSP